MGDSVLKTKHTHTHAHVDAHIHTHKSHIKTHSKDKILSGQKRKKERNVSVLPKDIWIQLRKFRINTDK